MNKEIVFISHEQSFSLPIEQTEKIIQWQKPVSVPLEHEFVLGIIKYHQKVVPVIDLSKLFYNKPTKITEQVKLIISYIGEQFLCFLVEDIIGIIDFEDDLFEEVESETFLEKEFLKSFIKTETDIILELNLIKLLQLKALLLLEETSLELMDENNNGE
ncbi:chemotaxis protein CheW [Vagococcus sp.]|uniref:chemotaxis protein CheW n=1 Tax=Vagococcus sp. TaxID=1933889 RepID=UPI003F9597F7